MPRLILALLLFAPFLAACDTGEDDPITTVSITGVSLLEIPFTDANGEPWDDGDNPDVYLRFLINGVSVANTREDAEAIGPSDLGSSLELDNDVVRDDLNATLAIEVRDRDSGPQGEDPIIGVTQALSLQTIADEERAARILTSTDGDTRLNVTFEYD